MLMKAGKRREAGGGGGGGGGGMAAWAPPPLNTLLNWGLSSVASYNVLQCLTLSYQIPLTRLQGVKKIREAF